MKLRLVKLLVLVLSLAIVAGMVMLAQLLYQKSAGVKKTEPMTAINLEQPKGSYIADYKAADDYWHLHIKGGGMAERVIVVDAKSKTIAAVISVR
ncbi:MAG: hypothetical protein IJ184_07045 [Alphaproteobacteria bacterium]|nr:hypothetical protein [Alphaproteobacteria bacterium]